MIFSHLKSLWESLITENIKLYVDTVAQIDPVSMPSYFICCKCIHQIITAEEEEFKLYLGGRKARNGKHFARKSYDYIFSCERERYFWNLYDIYIDEMTSGLDLYSELDMFFEKQLEKTFVSRDIIISSEEIKTLPF